MRTVRALTAALLVAILSAVAFAPPAQARTTAGPISLKVTANCFVGDTVRSFWVWTPEKGKKYGRVGSNKSVIDFGTFNKKAGNTYFTWGLDCSAWADGSGKKVYGGNLFQTGYSFTISGGLHSVKAP